MGPLAYLWKSLMWSKAPPDRLREELSLLRDRAGRQRRAGASPRAIHAIEQQIRALPDVDPHERATAMAGLHKRLDSLAVRLNRNRVSHGSLPVRITCSAHPGRTAVGMRRIGYHHVIFLCAECFAEAQREDEL